MPIYEFVCADCSACFEELVGVRDAAAPVCPKCGSAHTQRVLSTPAHCVKPGLPFPTPGAPGGGGGCGGKGFS